MVHGQNRLHTSASIHSLPPSIAAAEFMQQSIDFIFDRKRAIDRLCRMAEQIPMYALSFNRAEAVPALLEFLTTPEAAAATPSAPSLSNERRVGAA
jgi:hypothetical protein